MRFREYTKNEQAWIIFGGMLVVLGLVLLFGGHTLWWARMLHWFKWASRLAVPLALIVIVIYVMWAMRNDTFSQRFERMRQGRQETADLLCSTSDIRIAGVCGGIAQYFGMDSVIVRTVAVLLALASPLFMLITYGLLLVIMRKG